VEEKAILRVEIMLELLKREKKKKKKAKVTVIPALEILTHIW